MIKVVFEEEEFLIEDKNDSLDDLSESQPEINEISKN